jgi:hypothetical protein
MVKKIVLAISDTVYTAYLREDFVGAGFEVADSDGVAPHRYQANKTKSPLK